MLWLILPFPSCCIRLGMLKFLACSCVCSYYRQNFWKSYTLQILLDLILILEPVLLPTCLGLVTTSRVWWFGIFSSFKSVSSHDKVTLPGISLSLQCAVFFNPKRSYHIPFSLYLAMNHGTHVDCRLVRGEIRRSNAPGRRQQKCRQLVSTQAIGQFPEAVNK